MDLGIVLREIFPPNYALNRSFTVIVIINSILDWVRLFSHKEDYYGNTNFTYLPVKFNENSSLYFKFSSSSNISKQMLINLIV